MNNKKLIYKATCIINNKCYIGLTTQGLKRRMWCHKSIKYSGAIILKNAIKKYGFENFKFEVVEYLDTDKELIEREKYWIKTLNTLDPNGYNFLPGQVSGYELARPRFEEIICVETGEIFENAVAAGNSIGVGGATIWSTCSGRSDSANGFRFEYLNKEKKAIADKKRLQRKEKTKDRHIRAGKSKSKSVECIETQKKFESVKKAGEFMGLNPTMIVRVCKGKSKHTGGFSFRYI